jgi:predicted acyltransferase (DUF342 family)
MVFDKKTLVLPEDTEITDNCIKISGDAIIADRSHVEYDIKTDARIFIGEHVKIKGDLTAENDIHIDTWSEIDGNVSGGSDVYLGERVKVRGKLAVERDLDVGDRVELQDGFIAKGWINIRNPIPYIIYIFIYLIDLLRRGESEEVEKVIKELEAKSAEDIQVSETFLFVPRESSITRVRTRVKGNCRISTNCKVLGNYDVLGDMKIGNHSEILGSLKVSGNLVIGDESRVSGDIDCKGNVSVGMNCKIKGDVYCNKLEMYRSTEVEGMIKATEGMKFLIPPAEELEAKVARLEHDVSDIQSILE